MGHWCCQLYIQRAQRTSQTGGTQWDTVGQGTVNSEGTDNQPDKGHTLGTLGQPPVHPEGTDNQSVRGNTVGHTE